MNADRIEIESDERGLELHIWGDDPIEINPRDGHIIINIQNIDLDDFYDQVKGRIGPYLQERDQARRTRPMVSGFHPDMSTMPVVFACSPEDVDESGGYDRSDPKHKDWHSVHADHYDEQC